MSQRSFQSTLARLVIDTDFRDQLRRKGVRALGEDLTPIEQQRVLAIVAGKGLAVTSVLHESFRLTKIYTTMPLTRELLSPDRMAKEVRSFWKASPPESHYFLAESIAFCDFLLARLQSGLRVRYLDEVVNYERANLELRQPNTSRERPKPVKVKFEHDPTALFERLLNKKRPRAIPRLSCVLEGTVDRKGEVRWRFSA